MNKIDPGLELILNLSKVETLISKKFEAQFSVHGISFNDFIILYYLTQAQGQKLRRIDLAEAIGVTASGITRMLAPMEKIGLVAREINERDARVSLVILTPAGKRIFQESLKIAESVAGQLASKISQVEVFTQIIKEIVSGL